MTAIMQNTLALEITTGRWPAEDTGGNSLAHSRNECRDTRFVGRGTSGGTGGAHSVLIVKIFVLT